MAEAHNNNVLRPKLPSLLVLEAEGEAAAREIASDLLTQALQTGGKIDMQQLAKAGPDVRQAYLQLLADEAHVVLEPWQSGNKIQQGSKAVPPLPPAKPKPPSEATTSTATDTSLPRAELNWCDQRRPAVGFRTLAKWRGIQAGLLATAAALLLARLFDL